MYLISLGIAAVLIIGACGGAAPASVTTAAAPSATLAPTPVPTPTSATTGSTASPTADPLSTSVPLAPLRRGGLYILVRHGLDDQRGEAPQIVLSDCSTQANLIDATKRDLAQMAADIVALGIPIGRVLSSPYCRAMDTARIAFKKEPEVEEALLRGGYVPAPGQPTPPPFTERLERVRRILQTVVEPGGTNIVLVTHGDVIRGILGLDVAMGESVVVQRSGRSGSSAYHAIARVMPLGWKAP